MTTLALAALVLPLYWLLEFLFGFLVTTWERPVAGLLRPVEEERRVQ